jgi:hypothetical protein
MAKPKKISYELVKPGSTEGKTMYAMLNDLVEQFHEELTNARIALAWNLTWKADVDGHLQLGKLKRASDLDRELAAYDFVVMLNAEFWQDAAVSDAQRRALLDHELCHGAVKVDGDGEPVRDTKDRVVYRTRKHDVEEFSEIVERHGLYKRDLERFASALRRSKQGTLPLGPDAVDKVAHDPAVQDALRRIAPKPGSGVESVTISSGGESVTLTQEDRQRMDAAAKRGKGPLARAGKRRGKEARA